ncbi:hypothetical protein PRIPAC_73059 [Pristionchus pacificus]|uniref:Lipase n=1 Tax=Pristionchus pacificus TaxID=54126 RepID=A0A2A6BW44_PRIPA|nr:hypothetical protein PRIPAC_73059 [Pristionchus pacificus]|eukprot:PDM70232.1 lipase [Pristionchus pacificus]
MISRAIHISIISFTFALLFSSVSSFSRMRFLFLFYLPSLLIAIHHRPQVEVNKLKGPLTSHFQDWLNANGYVSDKFARCDYGTQGSYGEKSGPDVKIVNTPVVFIHGNSDSALAAGVYSGWTNSIEYFLEKGKNQLVLAELYATSWGDVNAFKSGLRTHDCDTTQRLRRFLIDVQSYTQSDRVHIIGHSMGVTFGRKITLGEKITASDGNCDIGSPLRFIDVFVGLAGANYVLCNCAGNKHEPTCNHDDGFWPGDSCGDNKNCGAPTMEFPCNGAIYSKFLTDLNQDFTQLARKVVSAWSKVDDMIQFGDEIWGKPT